MIVEVQFNTQTNLIMKEERDDSKTHAEYIYFDLMTL